MADSPWPTGTPLAGALHGYIDAVTDELVAFRRRIHANPELSGREYETTKAIAGRLEISDLTPQLLASGTGLICDVSNVPESGGDIPVIALRADIDALAMADESTTPYRSAIPGVAHACGHDVHTTVLLGAGLILNRILRHDEAPRGQVRLIFEPAEESLPGGAVEIIEQGLLDGVDAIYGLHCDPKLDVGTLGMTTGAITSAADLVDIELFGPGGHTARPEQTVDLVRAMGEVAINLPVEFKRSAGDGPVKLTFGHAKAGDAPNVVPSYARLFGTMRTQDMKIWQDAPELLSAVVPQVVEPTGARWDLDYRRGVPPVVNDMAATEFIWAVADAELGPGSVVQTGQSWGGDTFAWYLEKCPGSYVRLGTHNPDSNAPRLDLHASTFDVDERAITVGVRLLVATTLAWLAARSK